MGGRLNGLQDLTSFGKSRYYSTPSFQPKCFESYSVNDTYQNYCLIFRQMKKREKWMPCKTAIDAFFSTYSLTMLRFIF